MKNWPPRLDQIHGLEAPAWCEKLLAQFGKNCYGENIFRVVPSWSRVLLFGGYWEDNGLFQYRTVPKYGSKKVWVFERWLPARHYGSPQSWASSTSNREGYLSIGPYPKFGVYECCYLFAAPDHSYIPLLPDLVLLTAQSIYSGRTRKVWDIRNAILSEEQAKEQLKDKEFSDMWDECHGVRRGMSFSSTSVLQNNDAEKEEYIRKLASSDIRVQKEEFKPGFQQLTE
jgi:hypothetical protein